MKILDETKRKNKKRGVLEKKEKEELLKNLKEVEKTEKILKKYSKEEKIKQEIKKSKCSKCVWARDYKTKIFCMFPKCIKK